MIRKIMRHQYHYYTNAHKPNKTSNNRGTQPLLCINPIENQNRSYQSQFVTSCEEPRKGQMILFVSLHRNTCQSMFISIVNENFTMFFLSRHFFSAQLVSGYFFPQLELEFHGIGGRENLNCCHHLVFGQRFANVFRLADVEFRTFVGEQLALVRERDMRT